MTEFAFLSVSERFYYSSEQKSVRIAPMPVSNSFSEALESLLLASGKTKSQVGKKIGSAESSVRGWVTGASEPRASKLISFLEAVGADFHDLQDQIDGKRREGASDPRILQLAETLWHLEQAVGPGQFEELIERMLVRYARGLLAGDKG